ncbi:MAG: phytase [Rhodobacter sp.]|nr:phytase [Rhodobacter sp.]
MQAIQTAGLGLLLAAAPAISATAQTVAVPARGQTVPVGTVADDAADDPAIWRDPRNPERSLIVGTDKKAGLHVYRLSGESVHFIPAGRVNNVDLVDLGARGVLVVASDRNDPARALLKLYRLNTRSGALAAVGEAEGGAGEAYGVCLAVIDRQVHVFSVLKDGQVVQVRIDLSKASASGTPVRTLRVPSQAEGCVIDPRTATLYVGEEAAGVWTFDARPGGPTDGRLALKVDNVQLTADVEGLALLPTGRTGGWLVVSSQGDNAYALYRLPDLAPAGRFRIAGGALGSTEETDGIALAPGRFSRTYPDGIFVAQDGDNTPDAQNFKLASWAEILKAVRAAAP